jgi:hypothetical protein
MSNNEDLRQIKFMLEKIEAIIDTRLVGMEEPEPDETQAIADYESKKREEKLEFREI